MLDEEHARLLRLLADRYGVPMSSYLRGLLQAAWEAEEKGVNAAAALRRSIAYESLLRLGAAPVPLRLLRGADPAEARREGERLGAGLAGLLGPGLWDLLSALVERLGLGVAEYRRLLLLPQAEPEKRAATELVAGIARGAGMRVEDAGGVVVVERVD
jgi:hypothetical protein